MSNGLDTAATDAELNAPRDGVQRCRQRPEVRPVLRIAAPKIVLVKKAYQTHAHRLTVRLGTDSKFSGTGHLSSANANIRVYDNSGVLQALPLQISGSKLAGGVTLHIEGAGPSANVDASSLSLSRAGGDKTVMNSPATDSFTCVELSLELGQYKAATGGAAPAPVGDKIGVGRNVHLQTSDLWAGRAHMKVLQPLPADYANQVVLKPIGSRVRVFGAADEAPLGGQVALPLPDSTAAPSIPAGKVYWVEGAAASKKVLDTGFTLEISDLPGVEGERANITVVQAEMLVYGMPASPGAKPTALSAAEKLDPGRPVMLQNGAGTAGRGLVVVKRVKPKTWVGDLEFQVWDLAAGNQANPRLGLLAGIAPAVAQANPITHDSGFPSAGRKFWIEGVLASNAARDTQLRLRVSDAEGSADRANATVHEFYVKEIFFEGVVPIYYARIPHTGSYLVPPAGVLPRTHFAPVQQHPPAATAHWERQAGKNVAAQYSWPAAYGRKNASGVPSPTLRASFELFPKAPGNLSLPVHADGGTAGVLTETRTVSFVNGDAATQSFALKELPNTVEARDGMELEWHCDGPAHKTKHTLFFVDRMPRAADNLYVDQYLWEILEWSCNWAAGVKGRDPVFARIWARFNPAAPANAHATGLVYWKNWQTGVPPNQDMASAVQSQDPPTPANAQNAASCIVFDRVLINCLTLHGIAAAEVMLTPPAGTFVRAGVTYKCEGWVDTTVTGQANPAAPPSWESHWIAALKIGSWKYYDASYGAGPVSAPKPGPANSVINVLKFEPLTVLNYDCKTVALVPVATPLLRDPRASVAPHLVGEVLWENQ